MKKSKRHTKKYQKNRKQKPKTREKKEVYTKQYIFIDGSACPKSHTICAVYGDGRRDIRSFDFHVEPLQCEYVAFINTLKNIQHLKGDIIICSDSLAMVNQINEGFSCASCYDYWIEAFRWFKPNMRLRWVRREDNPAGQFLEQRLRTIRHQLMKGYRKVYKS